MYAIQILVQSGYIYIASDGPTSQYQHKKMIFLANNKTDVYWIFRQGGNRAMNGLGACIKQTIKDTITFDPNDIISNTGELMQYMADLSNQGLIQVVSDIGIPILGKLIWACLNLILRKIGTTIKCISSFLIKSIT